jgi:hypothetical protein
MDVIKRTKHVYLESHYIQNYVALAAAVHVKVKTVVALAAVWMHRQKIEIATKGKISTA